MKSFVDSLLASVTFLGFFSLPLMDLWVDHAIIVTMGSIIFILIFTFLVHEFCERYPLPIQPLDLLRHLFRRRFFL
jgi:hypothetical protein